MAVIQKLMSAPVYGPGYTLFATCSRDHAQLTVIAWAGFDMMVNPHSRISSAYRKSEIQKCDLLRASPRAGFTPEVNLGLNPGAGAFNGSHLPRKFRLSSCER
ncbi:unnamed protein product [Fusarium graminearum]|uniref:Chromosome 4, complete genome n=1 Tax=Gibberella zeae (strain ATCC MYA-4620 / CBS 123657 / FGSC 9075 / NRRL 31084 / PH-1) TaxID=229533 RepID=I1S8H6_GIBZE|nr:hypothetical protein FGSG_13154 [Fusarium graminearum PH-1]ESU13749.1 hypothetical protein FGSG_13154 [Fusarium graminearum PH-1]CEF85687.1 unnamed protein product [Fusarium graminearum]CZS73373.1 unnamed protein product [Fusarium graminearum]|eukprot:XP_011327256.1 hypothetical protein FGSG_13154 [Fusarium graminearum PH-1]